MSSLQRLYCNNEAVGRSAEDHMKQGLLADANGHSALSSRYVGSVAMLLFIFVRFREDMRFAQILR